MSDHTEDDVRLAQKAVRAYFHQVPWPGHNTIAAECQMCNESARISVEALAKAGRLRDLSADRFKVGDLAAANDWNGLRVEGHVTKVDDAGYVTIEVPQVGNDYRVVAPMVITAPAADFAKVESRQPVA